MSINAASAALEVLRGHGITAVFGNPGTTELALLDGFTDGPVSFHLGLNEAVATAMADGFARASGDVGVMLVHTAVGLANTVMGLINAQADNTPMVVLVGDKEDSLAGRGHFVEVPDIGGLARQTCKATWRVTLAEKLPELLQRGIKLAKTPPCGPVVITVPQNYFDATLPDTLRETIQRCTTPLLPPMPACRAEDVKHVLHKLRAAKSPLIIAGNEVGKSRKLHELVALVEQVGAVVVSEQGFTNNALNFPTRHPRYQGTFHSELEVVKRADVIVSLGAKLFMEYEAPRHPAFSSDSVLIQIGSDPFEINKIYAADKSLWCRAGDFLDEAHRQLSTRLDASASEVSRKDLEGIPDILATDPEGGLDVARAMSILSRRLPDNAIVVDESVGSKGEIHRTLALSEKHEYFGTCSGGLGWGVGASVGVQVARPEQRVVALLGDGATLFSVAGVWSAAHLRAPVIFLIINNVGYMEVKRGLSRQNGTAIKRGVFPGASLSDPQVDFVSLAKGFGILGTKCETPQDLDQALDHAFSVNAPFLIDMRVQQTV